MQFGLNLPAFGEYSDARYLANIAKEAEDAGWDGFFIWDHMIFDPSWHPIGDTWVGLAAVALNTSRVRIGPLLTPLPRRRPWKLSREVVALDQLSNGRLILGVGIGDPVQWEFGFFGEETDAKRRAEQLDEGLEILMGLCGRARCLATRANTTNCSRCAGGRVPCKRRACRSGWAGTGPTSRRFVARHVGMA